MIIDTFAVTDFRNLANLQLSFGDGVNIFYGNNGAGKTNLLEAIFVFLLGRSQRGATDAVLVRQDASYYRLDGMIRLDSKERELALAYEKGGRKKIALDGVTIRLAELYEHFSAVAAGPEDTAILAGSPSVRRQFLDMYLSQYSGKYLADLTDYQKALAQKNASLKNNIDPAPFDAVMAPIGTRIMQARFAFLDDIGRHAGDYYSQIAAGEQLTTTYKPSVKAEDNDMREGRIEERYYASLEAYRERERVMGVSMVGPHRDDVLFEIGPYPARTHGSQGQLRTGAISLKLAVYHLLKEKRRQPPMLLFDEIFAELDDNRSAGLVSA
ncbi:DNA replication and repair protein RecF, partial [candidate division GN15 bacterium]|nr:DNA replication and repair protein RecF [candidate division GN15 bacterium]